MSRSPFRHLPLIGPLTLGATLTLGALPALAQSTPASADCSAIHFELANPSPGSRVETGGLVVQGIATDVRAHEGTGIDRIQFFLDDRDQGGTIIGTAVPGVVPGPFGPQSFETIISMPNLVGRHDLFAYAHSAVSDRESIISMPITLGATGPDSTATPSVETTCTSPVLPAAAQPMAAPSTSTAPPPTTTTTIAGPAMAPHVAAISLEVANPQPDDPIHVGGYSIDGLAFDRSAAQGTGIDRISIFVDNRDEGGLLVGEATVGDGGVWHALATLPSNELGMHTLFFYAHSSVTDAERVVSIPVTLAP
jgi:hypothetical protein